MSEDACKHDNIEFDVSGKRAPDSNIVVTDIAARCAGCGVMFKWMGILRTTPKLGFPSVSDDAEWLSLPMVATGEAPKLPRILELAKGVA